MTVADPILSRIQSYSPWPLPITCTSLLKTAAAAQRLMLQHGIDSADLAPPSVQEITIDHDLANDTWFPDPGQTCWRVLLLPDVR